MAETTKIQWCDHTFNPWRGCTKVSPGCAHCYAEKGSKRNPAVLGIWGPDGTRVVAAESMWREPIKWNVLAAADGVRRKVFCASLADVFESWTGAMEDSRGVQLWKRDSGAWTTSDHYRDTVALTMDDVRTRLFDLICRTPNLDWLVLTKRPENALAMMVRAGLYACENPNLPRPQPNLWIGTSVEDQQRADERIPALLEVPAAIRFLSCEPLLGAVDLSKWLKREPVPCPDGLIGCEVLHLGPVPIHWTIIGGESGGKARPCKVEWIRDLLRQCKVAGLPAFVKQLGANPEGDPRPETTLEADGRRTLHVMETLTIRDRKGGDEWEWPADLRVRQFPGG